MSDRSRGTVPERCPIGCGRELGDDRLYADWYEPMGWWVVYHVRARSVEKFEDNVRRGGAPIKHSYCAQANLPRPDGSTNLADLVDRPDAANDR